MKKTKVIQVKVSEEMYKIVSLVAQERDIKTPEYIRQVMSEDIKNKMKG